MKVETLVARFEELRTGMPIVLKSCTECGEDHRGTLGKLVHNAPYVLPPSTKIIHTDVFVLEPRVHTFEPSEPSVADPRRLGLVISRIQIDQERVFQISVSE